MYVYHNFNTRHLLKIRIWLIRLIGQIIVPSTYDGKIQVVNFRYWKCGWFLSLCHMTQLGHISSKHEPPWPIRCNRRRAWPINVHAFFVNMDNRWMERFENYDCLVRSCFGKNKYAKHRLTATVLLIASSV